MLCGTLTEATGCWERGDSLPLSKEAILVKTAKIRQGEASPRGSGRRLRVGRQGAGSVSYSMRPLRKRYTLDRERLGHGWVT